MIVGVRKIGIILGLILIYMGLYAQIEIPNDAVLWLKVDANYKIDKKWRATAAQQLRWRNNMRTFKSSISEFTLTHIPIKALHVSAGYRLTIQNVANKNRVFVHVRYKQRSKRLKLNGFLYLKAQHNFNHLKQSTYLRPKVKISYSRKRYKWSPYITNEWFLGINNEQQAFDAYRIGVGMAYNIHKKQKITASYVYNNNFNTVNPAHIHIWRVNYSFGL